MLEEVRQDVTFGLRAILRTPLTMGAAVISLALGIGATTAMLGALDVWLVRPLPLPQADRLVRVYMANWDNGWTANAFSSRDFVDWREASRSVDLAAYRRRGASLATDERVERVGVLVTSRNLLDVLQLRTAVGRGFLPGEEQAGGPQVALLSDAFWRDAFGGERDVLGRTVVLDGVPHSVVGILPAEAAFSEFRADVWVPLQVAANELRSGHSLFAVGRLGPRVSLEQAREELGSVASRVAEEDPDRTFPGANVGGFRDALYGDEFHQGGIVVGAAVLFVLLIACANIANLLLARGARRSGELALRSVLGAARARILRQLLTESAVLALIGGALGVGVAYVAMEALRRWVLPLDLATDPRFVLDGRFLLVAVVATVLSTALFGLLPALAGSRIDLRGRLQERAAGGQGRGLRRVGRILVIGEVALALVLLVSTGLLTRSLTVMRSTDLGFRTDGLMAFAFAAPSATYPSFEEVRDFHDRVAERIAAIPGVTGLAASSRSSVGGWSSSLYAVPGHLDSPDDPRRSAQVRWTTSNYGDLMEIGLPAGSWFGDDADVPDGPPVAVVSRALAERHWDSPEAALGGQLELDGRLWTVVGVSEDVGVLGPANRATATLFRPLAQSEERTRAWVAEVPADADGVVGSIRRALREVDPSVALYGASPVAVQVRSTMGPQIAMRRILLTVGAIAIVLTLVGVYGVTAHMVGLRAREMGLRMAVGARPGEVVALVLRQAAWVALWGLAIGVAVSVAGGRALAFALVGVSPWDPLVLGAVTTVVGAAAVGAAVEPALRAARVDPVGALRSD